MGARSRFPSRLVAAFAVAAAGVAPTLIAGTAATSATTATKFTAVADAFVDKSHPGANYGTRTVLRTDSSPVQRSFLRFNVSGLADPIVGATLRLYAEEADADGFAVRSAGSGWKEGTVTWNTAPSIGSVVGSSGPVAAGSWFSVDVTSLVTGTGTVNLAVTSSSAATTRYGSRESGTHAPQLVVQTEPATTTTTAPPTTTTTAPTTTTTTAPVSSGCKANPPMNARQAMDNLLGYLWADGHFNGDTVAFHAKHDCVADRFAHDLKILGIQATVRVTDTGQVNYTLKTQAPYARPWENGVPPEMGSSATLDDLSFFLAGVLETEGSGSGKVDDDRSWDRTQGLVSVYSRFGIVVKPDKGAPTCGCSSDPSYWNTYVDPTASTLVYNGYIEIIRSWPFSNMSRVPDPR